MDDCVAYPCPAGAARCDLPCPGAADAPGPIVLEEVLERFDREAVRGTFDTGRYRMPYFSWGQGPPLLCVHGVSDSSASFLLPISRLARHFRCIAYDLPAGRGDGARLWRYSHAALVEDLLALVDHLKLDRVYLLGASFGSTVVLEALRARPRSFPRAVLQGGLAYRPLRRAELALARLGRFLPGSMKSVPLREKMLLKVNGQPFEGRPESVWRALIEWTGRSRIAAFAHQVLWLHTLDLRPHLETIRQPVLLVVGDRDPVVPPRVSEVLARGLPNAGRAVLEGCGHLPAYTHPEAFAEVVRRFLTPPGAGCGGAGGCSGVGPPS